MFKIRNRAKGAAKKNIIKTEILNTNSLRWSVFLSIISTIVLSVVFLFFFRRFSTHAETDKTIDAAG